MRNWDLLPFPQLMADMINYANDFPKIRFRIQGDEIQFKVEFVGADGKQHLRFEVIKVTGAMDVAVIESMIAYIRHPMYHSYKTYEEHSEGTSLYTRDVSTPDTIDNDSPGGWNDSGED